jgi:FdhE protein
MTEVESPYGPRNIGKESKPPFAVLPDPSKLFLARSKRLLELAPGHTLEAYLRFVADAASAQHEIQAGLPGPVLPEPDAINQALKHGIPPLSTGSFIPSSIEEVTLERFLQRLTAFGMPEEAAAAARAIIATDRERRHKLMVAALTGAPADSIAERVLVLAGLQVAFARLAAKLPGDRLTPVVDSVCPACGSPPMTSAVVGWPAAHNSRFCSCSLCGTWWNVVRIKCVFCSSTGGIRYHSIEERPREVKAETCEDCGHYLKILYQVKDHHLDPFSDDVATLDLDMLLSKEGWTRGGHNPFLLGY